jgi:hypothetical protein
MEAQSRVIIGSCLVEATGHNCPISIINTTDQEIELRAPHVEIEPMEKEIEVEILTTKLTKIYEIDAKSLIRIENMH